MKKAKFFYIAGVVLIAASIALLITDKKQTTAMQTQTKQVVSQLQNIIPSRSAAIAGQYTVADMPVYEIDGVDYCALLEIASVSARLPIADSWNNADTATARFDGSIYDDSMIIGGQNLGFVTQLDIGDKVTVVDMLGGEFNYTVDKIERANDVDMEKLSSTEHQLDIFAYIAKEKKYVVVRCSI